jgi:hypothetical protein
MSKQILEYFKEMKAMYEIIMKKCVNEGVLTDLDIMFLEIYKKTIEKEGIS